MTTTPEPDDILALARIAGVPIDGEVAARIIRSIGPGLEGFAPVSATLPFDIEPASFVAVQLAGAKS